MFGDKNRFMFNEYGDITHIVPKAVLGSHNLIYVLAADLIKYTQNPSFHKADYRDGLHHWHSDEDNGIDKIIDEYTNWCEGCSLNNSLAAIADMLYDYISAVVANGKQRSCMMFFGECSYVGLPIHNVIKHHSYEIITDALSSYQEYIELCASKRGKKVNKDYTDQNEGFVKLLKGK